MRLPSRTFLVAVVLLQASLIGYLAPSIGALFSPSYWKQLQRFGQTMDLTHRHYVDPEAASYAELGENAAQGMLITLDPYSTYFSPPDLAEFSISTEQHYEGIGVEIRQLDSGIFIVNVFPGGPADEAGLRIGDRIVAVNEVSTEGERLTWVVDRVRGEPDSTVDVTVQSVGSEDSKTVTVRRRAIDFDSIDRVERIDDGLLYLRIRQFGNRTTEELLEILTERDPAIDRRLLIDLRGNPGGLLTVARDTVDLFVPAGETVVMTVDREGKVVDRLESRRPPVPNPPEIFILQDRSSASASEIFSGALRQLAGASILGETSFGKGSVQSLFRYRDGAGLKLTTQRYTLPDGTVVHGTGVEPDFPLEMEEDSLFRAELSRTFSEMDPLEFEAEFGFPPQDDTVLNAALETIRTLR